MYRIQENCPNPWIYIPVGYLYCIGNPRTGWLYHTEADPGLNGRTLRDPRGKVLDGCSSINGMIYMRGHSRGYDAWATLTGDEAWRWDACLPDFIAHENHWRRDASADRADDPSFAALHGHGSEGRVEKQRLRWDILDAFAQASQQVGIPATDDFNRGSNEGVSYFEGNQKGGWRWNTAKAFLRPTCYGRPNFELWNGALPARRIHPQQCAVRPPDIQYHVQPLSWTLLANRCTASTPSPPAFAISTPAAAQRCRSKARALPMHRLLRPAISAPKKIVRRWPTALRLILRIVAQPGLAR